MKCSVPRLSPRLILSNYRREVMTNQYDGWTREMLIGRLMALEGPKGQTTASKYAIGKDFLFSKHPRRKIALKFCYSGWEYGGLAHQTKPGPLPTVEGVLFDALAKARLIDPSEGFEGCGWEKCGRTDRGVSAAGQVVSLWIRSALSPDNAIFVEAGRVSDAAVSQVPPLTETIQTHDSDNRSSGDEFANMGSTTLSEVPASLPSTKATSKRHIEHDYLTILNRLLPPTIRVLAWSPVSSTFSARFSCLYRHYKYFFSSNGLDLDRMRKAASRLVGEHDFRNLCKLDPAKQITVFKRKVIKVNIEPVEGFENESLYVFDLVGTAFLYHQVRHIMAILFLVGTGLEHPSAVSALLNVEAGMEQQREGDPSHGIVNCKPEYQMADALPLMLWECGYDEKELTWQTSGKEDDVPNPTYINGGELYHQLQSIHNRSQIYTALDYHFLRAASCYHPPPPSLFPIPIEQHGVLDSSLSKHTMNIPLGGGTFKRAAKYKHLLKRNRLDPVEVTNERWRLGKGFRKDEKRKLAEGVNNDDNE